jgi:hypothetical protein
MPAMNTFESVYPPCTAGYLPLMRTAARLSYERCGKLERALRDHCVTEANASGHELICCQSFGPARATVRDADYLCRAYECDWFIRRKPKWSDWSI